MFGGITVYKAEAVFHTLLNRVEKTADPWVAETIAIEMYNMAYGLDSPHPWSTVLHSKPADNPYFDHFKKYAELYRKSRASTLGISFMQFMSMPRDEMVILIDVLLSEATNASTAPS